MLPTSDSWPPVPPAALELNCQPLLPTQLTATGIAAAATGRVQRRLYTALQALPAAAPTAAGLQAGAAAAAPSTAAAAAGCPASCPACCPAAGAAAGVRYFTM
jgi:hypothetical protein